MKTHVIARTPPPPPPPPKIEDEVDYFFNDEISLLTVLILFEQSKGDVSLIPFKTFSQFPFEKIKDIAEELHDFQNVADYIYNQCFSGNFFFAQGKLVFFTIDKIIIDRKHIVTEILYKFGTDLVAEPTELAKDISSHYSYIIENYFELKKKWGIEKDNLNIEDIELDEEYIIEVKPNKFRDYSNDLLDCAPRSIRLNFIFKKEIALEAEKHFNEYLVKNYDEESLTEFQDYISNLKFTNGNLKIPFEAITNEEFNLIETLKYLDLMDEIEIGSWIGKNNHWEIRLLSKKLLGLFIPNIDLLVQKNDSFSKAPEVHFTEDGNLEYEGKPTIFDLTPLRKVLCRYLYSKPRNYNFETIEIEKAVYGGENTKQSQEKLKKLIEGLNGKIRDEFGIKEWIHYGANNLRRLV